MDLFHNDRNHEKTVFVRSYSRFRCGRLELVAQHYRRWPRS